MSHFMPQSGSRRLIMFVAGITLVAGVGLSPGVVRVTAQSGPGDCPNDSKLLNDGPTRVEGSGPGTWWGLSQAGLIAAGLVDAADQIEYLNSVFGTSFSDLAALQAFTSEGAAQWDENGNGYVCAYELRGRRAYFDDPLINLTAFGISDDKLKNH